MGTPNTPNPLAPDPRSTEPTPSEGAQADLRERLVLTLAKLMATYGIPAHRLEEAAAGCARHLGLEAQFFATPTAVFASMGGLEGAQRTHLLRLEPGEVNLEKQSLVDGVLRDVLAGEVEPETALTRLDDIVRLPARFGPAVVVGAQAVASANAAVFFGGGWREALAAAIVGLVVGMLGILASRVRRTARLVDFAAGLAAAALAIGLAGVLTPLAPTMVVLAGVIVLVPGLTLTTAVTELATRNLAAGTARLMGAMTVLISIGFGVGVGQRLGAEVFGVAGGSPQSLGELAHALSLAVAPLALAVLFQARPRDWMVIAPAGWIGYLGARWGAAWLGPELGVCLGAFAVGLASNTYARLADRPSGVPLVPGIMLLVPGSLGFRSVTAFVEANTLAGVASAFNMLLVATGLVVGLLLANAAVTPRRAL